MWTILFSSSLSSTGQPQQDLATRRRGRLEQVLLGPHDARHRRDDLFADRVQRRVGHLREEFDEVVVEQPGPLRQHRRRGVGAHRAQRFGTGGRHRASAGFADPPRCSRTRSAGARPTRGWAARARGRAASSGRAVRRAATRRTAAAPASSSLISSSETMRPAAVSIRNILPGSSRPLATICADGTSSTPLSLARMMRSSMVRHHRPGRNPLRSNTAPTTRAVGERHAGRAVPRLHQRCVELPERPPRWVHRGVVLPRLGDHHQHRVRQAAAAEVQQLEHLVEGRRVGRVGRADRREPARSPGILRAGQHRLAGVHAVAVAAHGVDLAVVGDEAERVGQRPGREGVGGEPAVHDRDGAHAAFVAQVRKVLRQLHRREHALVGDGPAGQRREVDVRRASALLAQRVDPTVEVDAAGPEPLRSGAATNSCAMYGMQPSAVAPTSAPSGSTGTSRQPRTSSPSSAAMASICSRAAARAAGSCGRKQMPAAKVLQPSAVGAGSSKSTTSRSSSTGSWMQDARAVTAVGFGARGAAVLEVFQGGEAVGDDGVRAPALDVGDHGDAAGVGLVLRVVQALGLAAMPRTALESTSAVSEISSSGTAPARVQSVSAQLGGYPSRSVGTSGNPGMFRTTVQVIASDGDDGDRGHRS